MTTTFKRMFALDLRSLALFRMTMGALILADLATRIQDLSAHYTDYGVLPRAVAIPNAFANAFSLHNISGTWGLQLVLFAAAALFAFSLLCGYKTRLATIGSWILLVSLHNRNVMVLNGGDVLLRCLLFWSMFLPLGARMSMDAALAARKSPANEYRALPGVAIILQVCMVYWSTAILKHGDQWLWGGTATHYALQIDQFATPLGLWFREIAPPDLLKYLTYGVWFFEALGPFLLIMPFLTGMGRMVGILGFSLMHLSFGSMMKLGLFPYIDCATLLIFLPGQFWDSLSRKLPRGCSISLLYDPSQGPAYKGAMLLGEVLSLGRLPRHRTDLGRRCMRASWAVQDRGGSTYYGRAALDLLVRESVVGRWGWVRRALLFLSDGQLAKGARQVARVVSPPKGRWHRVNPSLLGSIICVGFLGYALSWNLMTLNFRPWGLAWKGWKVPEYMKPVAGLFRIDQKWAMFSPFPSTDDGWYVIEGYLKSGKRVNVLDGLRVAPSKVFFDIADNPLAKLGGVRRSFAIREDALPELTEAKPPLVSATYKNQRWRKYMMNIWSSKHNQHRLYFGRWVCRQWNMIRVGDERLNNHNIYFIRERSTDGAPQQPKKVTLWNHDCLGEPKRTRVLAG